jgi:hypothetical protein
MGAKACQAWLKAPGVAFHSGRRVRMRSLLVRRRYYTDKAQSYVTNSNPNYNGSNVVDKSSGNIVFVNFNYRVSAYGFLASEKIRKDGDLNVGLLDQRKAMKWVKKYISLVSNYFLSVSQWIVCRG